MNFNSITETIDRVLESAGLKRNAPGTGAVRATIDRALAAAGLTTGRRTATEDPKVRQAKPRSTGYTDIGQFLARRHTGVHGSLAYKLYIPASYDGSSMPLVVMLHGCTQNPDDFATGTRMNELGELHGFLVAYPAQAARSHRSKCWKWFESAQQTRDGSEPSLITGIVSEIAGTYEIERRQVYIAGLSAGAAMAVILGREYPDVFAAVAAHSGLPAGAAHDVPSAFAAMHGHAAPARPAGGDEPCVPTIVFHGDADATVTLSNGAAIVSRAISAFERRGEPLQPLMRLDAAVGGRRCTTTEFLDASGNAVVEEWVVHGGAHAWYGGCPEGSYTDPTGPDASAEIVRFFLRH